jgi:hypothetical protein
MKVLSENAKFETFFFSTICLASETEPRMTAKMVRTSAGCMICQTRAEIHWIRDWGNNDWAHDWVNDRASNWVNDWARHWAHDWVSDWANVWANDWAISRVNDWAND